MALQPPERTKAGPEARRIFSVIKFIVSGPGTHIAWSRPLRCAAPAGWRRSGGGQDSGGALRSPKAEHETSHSPKTFKRTPIRRRTLERVSLKCARNSRVAPNRAVCPPTGGDIANLIPTEPPPVASRAAASAMTVGERGNYNNDGGGRPEGLRFLVGLLNVDDELH